MANKIYLLDVSGFIYRSYYALPPMKNQAGLATQALFGFIRQCLKLIKDFNPEYMVAVFDGPNNKQSRLEMFEGYKSGRSKAPEDLPHQIEYAKTFCQLIGIPIVELEGVEADDAIGSIAKCLARNNFEVIICSSDKDMCQLVSKQIYILQVHKDNFIIDEEKVLQIYGITPSQIVDYLALIGDASDNIPGVAGIGPKSAASLLQEYGTLESLYENVLKIKGKKQALLLAEQETAFLSKRLATIITDLPVPDNCAFYTFKQNHSKQLLEFYKEHHFGSLQKEVLIQEEKPVDSNKQTTYHLVDDESSLENLFNQLKNQKEIAFDVETTSLDVMEARLVGIGFCFTQNVAYYVPTNGQLGFDKVQTFLQKLFAQKQILFYGHNVKYDIHVLDNAGVKIDKVGFDTMIASYLLYAQSRNHSLEALSLHYLGRTKTPLKDVLGSSKNEWLVQEAPLEIMCNYCGLDVDLTYQIKQKLEEELKERHLLDLLNDLELPLLIILEKMEKRGIFVDLSDLRELSHIVNVEIEKVTKEIYNLAGQEFNISSPKQLGIVLERMLDSHKFKKTATGAISTSADVLEELKDDHEIAARVLEYRTYEKLKTTYIETLPLLINPITKRIHCTFNQSVAATGRLSCQNPNLQNIPVRSNLGREIRKAFKPQNEGYSFLGADYSQIELRLLAHLSEDPFLLKAFENDEDIHAFTASLIFDKPLKEVTAVERQSAKTVNFGIIYGQTSFGLSKELGISMSLAKSFIEAYHHRFQRVFEFLTECKEKAKKLGYAETMIGRQREIPEISSKNPILRGQAERLAINTPLQGTAADLIKLAMIRVEKKCSEENLVSKMILQIHDELVFEAKDSELSYLKEVVKESMENVFRLKVPLKVDIAIGKNWKEC